ncbi:MAG: hypothetical protein II942_03515 [Alphaproteobacteria bacterium]|nr:hypothetical protein [Alphaproteobacteria bacterium]
MTIRNKIRKVGGLLLTMTALAAAGNLGVGYARVAKDADKKADFDKAPALSIGGHKGETKASIMGKELPLSNGPLLDAALAGLLLTEVIGKKKGKGK